MHSTVLSLSISYGVFSSCDSVCGATSVHYAIPFAKAKRKAKCRKNNVSTTIYPLPQLLKDAHTCSGKSKLDFILLLLVNRYVLKINLMCLICVVAVPQTVDSSTACINMPLSK